MLTFTIPAFILIIVTLLLIGFGVGAWILLTWESK